MHKRHRPLADQAIVRPYFFPVRLHANPAAHGGVCVRDICRCGAIRDTNVNGRHTEYGPWRSE